jgi:hypothetical protein
MRSKWFRRIKRFIELFTPGGTEYTSDGFEIHYTSDGVSSIPASQHKRLLFMKLDEFKKASLRLDASSDQRGPN